eukprot:CAMPEP_0182450276 /NCGR_PEP_ID=MMETSP1172-20130603/40139_1 /TAXON_ID=708627 /ORGANISM="Timspurckia oligopyrenoides, Strain CCMP3278" /LENGTH=593 /DNA_ID=CAMNT_0024647823 /DNA_START=55 /DNA_END=1836 /DNA_ORIENTATION=-
MGKREKGSGSGSNKDGKETRKSQSQSRKERGREHRASSSSSQKGRHHSKEDIESGTQEIEGGNLESETFSISGIVSKVSNHGGGSRGFLILVLVLVAGFQLFTVRSPLGSDSLSEAVNAAPRSEFIENASPNDITPQIQANPPQQLQTPLPITQQNDAQKTYSKQAPYVEVVPVLPNEREEEEDDEKPLFPHMNAVKKNNFQNQQQQVPKIESETQIQEQHKVSPESADAAVSAPAANEESNTKTQTQAQDGRKEEPVQNQATESQTEPHTQADHMTSTQSISETVDNQTKPDLQAVQQLAEPNSTETQTQPTINENSQQTTTPSAPAVDPSIPAPSTSAVPSASLNVTAPESKTVSTEEVKAESSESDAKESSSDFLNWFKSQSEREQNATERGKIECPEKHPDGILCKTLFRLLRKYKVRIVVDVACHKTASWTPLVIEKLAAEYWGFKYICVLPDKEEMDKLKASKQLERVEQNVNYIEGMWWKPLDFGGQLNAEFYFAWDTLCHTSYGRVWSFFSSSQSSGAKYYLFDNYPALSNDPSPKREFINVRRHPFKFGAAKDTIQNVTDVDENPDDVKRQLVMYTAETIPSRT